MSTYLVIDEKKHEKMCFSNKEIDKSVRLIKNETTKVKRTSVASKHNLKEGFKSCLIN